MTGCWFDAGGEKERGIDNGYEIPTWKKITKKQKTDRKPKQNTDSLGEGLLKTKLWFSTYTFIF